MIILDRYGFVNNLLEIAVVRICVGLTRVNIGVVNSENSPYIRTTDVAIALSISSRTLTNAASLLLKVNA